MMSSYNIPNCDENNYYRQMYDAVYARVRNFILSNSGTIDDALDVIQETMIVVLLMNRDKDALYLSCQENLFYVIAKRNWYKRLRAINRHETFMAKNEEIVREMSAVSEDDRYTFNDVDVILYESINKLESKYQNVILTSLRVKNNKEGARLMNYTDRYYAKMLHISRKLLRERILVHPMVLEIIR